MVAFRAYKTIYRGQKYANEVQERKAERMEFLHKSG
jgi:hypothetical protein